MLLRILSLAVLIITLACAATSAAAPKKKLLLIGQGPDGHPVQTHEYFAGLRVLEKSLAPMKDHIDIVQVRADGDWKEGPDLLVSADGAVLYLAEGAKWIQADPRRYEAFTKLAQRGGGLVALHWAIGTREAKNVAGFQQLFGACHGGDDRKYKFLETSVTVVGRDHPITRGIDDFTIKDEFYYRLKFVDDERGLQPLLTVVEKRATFACTPGARRPGMAIAPGLWACGDYVEGPYPATLEGAVMSAQQAVAAISAP